MHAAGGNGKAARRRLMRWLNDYDTVSAWLERRLPHGLEAALARGNGFVRIEHFLPEFVATGVLQLLTSIPESSWNLTAADDDQASNNIRHNFYSIKQGPPGLAEAFRVLSLLCPESLHTFSAAKYLQDWATADGGELVDLEARNGPKQMLPTFNSLVAFTIPRWHEVKAVCGSRTRYSLFGWFLQPGKLYELNKRAPRQPQLLQQQQQQQQDEEEEKEEGKGMHRQKQQQQHPSLEKKKMKRKQHRLEGQERRKGLGKKSRQQLL